MYVCVALFVYAYFYFPLFIYCNFPAYSAAIVINWLIDYCCSVLAGISGHQLSRVRPERRGATDFLGKDVRPHNSTAPWTPLASNPGADPVPVVCVVIPQRCLHGTAPSYRAFFKQNLSLHKRAPKARGSRSPGRKQICCILYGHKSPLTNR